MYSAGVTGHDVAPFSYQFFDVDIYFLLFTRAKVKVKVKQKGNFSEHCKSENQKEGSF